MQSAIVEFLSKGFMLDNIVKRLSQLDKPKEVLTELKKAAKEWEDEKRIDISVVSREVGKELIRANVLDERLGKNKVYYVFASPLLPCLLRNEDFVGKISSQLRIEIV